MFFACKISYLFWVFVWPYCRASSPTESRLLWNPLTRDTMWSSGETDQERGQPWQSHWPCYGVYCPEIFLYVGFLTRGCCGAGRSTSLLAEAVAKQVFRIRVLLSGSGSNFFFPSPDRQKTGSLKKTAKNCMFKYKNMFNHSQRYPFLFRIFLNLTKEHNLDPIRLLKIW